MNGLAGSRRVRPRPINVNERMHVVRTHSREERVDSTLAAFLSSQEEEQQQLKAQEQQARRQQEQASVLGWAQCAHSTSSRGHAGAQPSGGLDCMLQGWHITTAVPRNRPLALQTLALSRKQAQRNGHFSHALPTA